MRSLSLFGAKARGFSDRSQPTPGTSVSAVSVTALFRWFATLNTAGRGCNVRVRRQIKHHRHNNKKKWGFDSLVCFAAKMS